MQVHTQISSTGSPGTATNPARSHILCQPLGQHLLLPRQWLKHASPITHAVTRGVSVPSVVAAIGRCRRGRRLGYALHQVDRRQAARPNLVSRLVRLVILPTACSSQLAPCPQHAPKRAAARHLCSLCTTNLTPPPGCFVLCAQPLVSVKDELITLATVAFTALLYIQVWAGNPWRFTPKGGGPRLLQLLAMLTFPPTCPKVMQCGAEVTLPKTSTALLA